MDLTSKDYYNLKYSLIPDNIYQQIVGVNKEIQYSTRYDEDTELYTSARVYLANGTVRHADMTDYFDWNTTNNYYENVYREEVTYTSDGAFYPTRTRTEKVVGIVQAVIAADVPIKYLPDLSSVAVAEVQGIYMFRSQTNQTGIEGAWGEAFYPDTNKLYGLVNMNMTGAATPVIESLNSVDIKDVIVDSYYDGSRLNAYGKYMLQMDIHFYMYAADFYNKAGILGNTSELTIVNATRVKFNIPYYAASTVDEEFEYHVDTVDYENYPLKIEGNYLTTRNTVYDEGEDEIVWDEFISGVLLNKYQNGKLWVSAKVKASFLIDNNLSIDSKLNIKKLNGTYVMHLGSISIFQLKNIEYVYDGSQFIANIILLEV